MSAPTANLSRLLRFHVVRRGSKEALVDLDRRWTYAELDRDVDRHAQALLAAGARPGEVVAVLARNSATYVLEMLATARIGAVFLPLNWRLHERELSYVCDHAQVATLLVDEDFHDKAEALGGLGSLRATVTHADNAPAGWPTLDSLLTAVTSDPVPDAEVGLDDLQRILYTSGTTSHPKGVMHTHGNVIWNQLGQLLELELTTADRTMVSAPLFHVSGIEAPGHATLYAGGTMVMTRSYAGRDIVEVAARERVTGMVLAAQIVYDILAMPDLADFDLSPLRFIIFGGVPAAGRRAVQDAFPHVRLVDTFGMTELTNGACYMDAAHSRTMLGAQGTPFPHLDLRIVGPDDEPLPPGEIGEIAVRGLKVSPGYWRDAEATAKAWRNGWFHSGDMASIDEQGFLWFADRKTDMIRSGGENVASAEIERVLATHADVAEVAVIGIPDPKWDEVPKGFVILRPGATATADDLIAHCAANLAKFKVPKAMEIVSELPRNDSGKVLKRLLRREAL
jgi:acyl-CoA synthetase (AMP-forming)/AMP-acid ligase II